jgi:hypothetical protein
MSRPVTHAAVRPFRISRSAAEAHQGHTSPFFGCPLCIRRSPMKSLEVRWTSPRHG